jgi:heme-degrading monooxygenase HmoA
MAAFRTAEPIIAAAPGFGGLELRRCVENEHRFLLLVHWDTVASHELGFRGSAGYQKWKRLLHHFYEPFPTVEHFLPMTGEAEGSVQGLFRQLQPGLQ